MAKNDSEMFLESKAKDYKEISRYAIEFVSEFDRMTDKFQDDAANALSSDDYERLFRLPPSVRIRLTDPKAVDNVYGEGVFAAATSKPPPQ